MKTYQVLCGTCNGTGFIMLANFSNTTESTPTTDICPVCNGSRVQTITETDPEVEALSFYYILT